MPFVMFAILSFISAGIHILATKPHFHDALSILLLHLVVVNCGLAGLFAFLGHTAKGDDIAREIGWPREIPFNRKWLLPASRSAVWVFSVFGFAEIFWWPQL